MGPTSNIPGRRLTSLWSTFQFSTSPIWERCNVSPQSDLFQIFRRLDFYFIFFHLLFFVVSPYEGEKNWHVSDGQDIHSSLPLSHPQHSARHSILAIPSSRSYSLPDERDLETSILQFTHAVFLSSPLATEGGSNPVLAFFLLAEALLHRSLKFQQPDDLKYCVKYLRYVQGQSREALNIAPHHVTALLMRALGLQAHLEPGHAMQDVEEMSVLCHKLLTSDVSESYLKDAIGDLAQAVLKIALSRNQLFSQQVIECLRDANTRLPDLYDAALALALSLVIRFIVTRSMDDYEDAMTVSDKIISRFHSDGSQYPFLAFLLPPLLIMSRFAYYRNPEYLEESIFRLRAYLGSLPPEHPLRPALTRNLTILEKARIDEFGVTNVLQQAYSKDPEIPIINSFSDLSASLTGSNFSSLTMGDQKRHLEAVLSVDDITNIEDIEEATNYCRLLHMSLQSSPENPMTHLAVNQLGGLLLTAFKRTLNSKYLNGSITISRGLLKIQGVKRTHFRVVGRLITSLYTRFQLCRDKRDLDEIMELYPIAVEDPHTNVPNRFSVACQWADTSRIYKHTSVSTAYENAISLMQETLTFAPTIEIQHFRLITRRNQYEELPLNYASHQIQIGQLDKAIETLERGRGLLWSEMRGLRTSIDQLRAIDLPLAEKFASVNQDLEALTMSISPSVWMNDVKADNQESMDPFGRLVTKQRNLLDKRNDLIMQIQALPGFERFMTPLSFDTLRSAAPYGPVIIINHCDWRSDIIILFHDSLPSLIPTSHDFCSRANGIRDKLFDARKKGLDSMHYEDILGSVLRDLYDLVGRPVIERFRTLNVPEQSRIWWCPTSVFCSLPLHAMGPIRSDGNVDLYFSDLYIPSYTPTLSALIEARKPSTQTSNKPSILLVALPDSKMPKALQEMLIVQANSPSVTTLIGELATPSVVLEHMMGHQFAHISCHGILETGRPFDASFKLHEGAHLTLLDIVRSRLPNAEFAFLSACHTAELTEESIADEGLHLTAAVQYCGFRSVVGTMWAMADIDGPDLAVNFYRAVFSDRQEGIPYYERTAEALRNAVRSLRRKRNMRLERWVNFVHYGA